MQLYWVWHGTFSPIISFRIFYPTNNKLLVYCPVLSIYLRVQYSKYEYVYNILIILKQNTECISQYFLLVFLQVFIVLYENLNNLLVRVVPMDVYTKYRCIVYWCTLYRKYVFESYVKEKIVLSGMQMYEVWVSYKYLLCIFVSYNYEICGYLRKTRYNSLQYIKGLVVS